MKNEERILELLAETLQRIDRHSETIELHSKSIEQQNKNIEQQNKNIEQQNKTIEQQNKTIEQQNKTIEQQNKSLSLQLAAVTTLMEQAPKIQERLDQHGDALGALRERTEVMHQTSLEQQKAYQAMTQLLLHHNQALINKGIL